MVDWRSLIPTGKVYLPKYVCINNPRLAVLHLTIFGVTMAIALIQFTNNGKYNSSHEVDGQVYVTSFRLQRPLAEIQASAKRDEASKHCSAEALANGDNDYEYGGRISISNISCAPVCGPVSSLPCVTPGELVQVSYGRDIFIPTMFREEIVEPGGEAQNASHHFVPAVEDSLISFSHQYTVRRSTDTIQDMELHESGHSSFSTLEDAEEELVKTVLMAKDGTIAKSWEPGEAIVLRLRDIIEHSSLIEFSDDVSKLELDTKYTRVDENIIDDVGDSGVTVRVSGVTIYIDIHYTNENSCQLNDGFPPVSIEDNHGKVACISAKAIRHWVTRRAETVLNDAGSYRVRQYNGVQIEFRPSGTFTYVDSVALSFAITTLLVWAQIPAFIIYYFITTVLGKLSEIYSRVIHQSMSINEAVTGLGARLIGHSSAYLDVAESRTDGIDKMRMVERFRLIFADNEELDDEEIIKLVNYIHTAMTGEEDPESPLKVQMVNFCLSATSNEPLSFDSIVHIFDKDRTLGCLESFCNDESVRAIREDKFDQEGSSGAMAEEHSQLDEICRNMYQQKNQYSKLSEKVNATLGHAEKTLAKEADSLFEHRRQELAKQGAPVSRPPVQLPMGATYHGDWVGNSRHGYGIEFWPDGTTYEGQWAAGRLHGHAVYRQPNGAKYAGQWQNGKQHGKGVHVSESGAKYEGQFQQGSKNGKGKIYLVDGSTYDGDVVNDNMHGKGTYEWVDGKTYTGEWVNNLMHGQGTYTFNDGCVYSGAYCDNEKHGHGTFKWPDGKRYEGQYVNNKRSGTGVFVMPDGTRIEGTWKDGKQDGPGTVTSANGKVQKAKWDMGILVQS